MRNIILSIPILLLISCTQSKKHPELMATIYPYTLLLQQLAGNRLHVSTLIPPNASPHTYSPTTRDIRKLQKAKLIVANGMGLEGSLLRKLVQIKDRVIFAGKYAFVHNKTHSHTEDHTGQNPHIWMNYQTILQTARKITQRLKQIDPSGAPVFQKNLLHFVQTMKSVDKKIHNERKIFQQPGLITFHDAFYYFRKRYKIQQIATIAASPGRQPSSKELITIGRKIQKAKASTIFIEPQLNPKAARIIAKEYGLIVNIIDPLGTTTGVQTLPEHFLKSWSIMKKSFDAKR